MSPDTMSNTQLAVSHHKACRANDRALIDVLKPEIQRRREAYRRMVATWSTK